MLDGTIDGHESYEAAVGRHDADAARRRPGRRHRHALLVGHHRPAEGRHSRVRARRRSTRPAASVATLLQMLFGGTNRRASTCRPRRSTTPRRCASPWLRRRWDATVVAMEHFDAEQYLALDRAVQGDRQPGRADDVRAHAEAARRGARRSTTCRRCRCVIHAAAPCPIPVKKQIIEWFGPIAARVLRGHRGQRLRVLQQRDVAGPPGHGRHADRLRRAHLRRRRRGAAALRERHDLLRGRRDVRVPQRRGEDGVVAAPEGLVDARRRRLPRRRQLPVPDRPQGVHDHLRRREHLPAGGRERARDASEGRSTSPCSACPTTTSAKR